MTAYYNEFDKDAAAWLRVLIDRGLIAPGVVDERDIQDVRPDEIRGFTQCHFFAGIGGWPLALRNAGWPDDRPIWTGSCPCQPFSQVGNGDGANDERHLWPAFRWLIMQCRPPVVAGEQVASKDGREWASDVQTDLENMAYRPACADLCSAGIGAPQIRQRLYWVADTQTQRPGETRGFRPHKPEKRLAGSGETRGMAHSSGDQLQYCITQQEQAGGAEPSDDSPISWLGYTYGPGPQGCGGPVEKSVQEMRKDEERLISVSGVPVYCADGKVRFIEPSISPMADGIPARVVRLRGYGNAIDPRVAAEFIASYMDATEQS